MQNTEQYKERLKIPITGNSTTKFWSERQTILAIGYERIVIGERGPYIEFNKTNIIWDKFSVPADQFWRKSNTNCYYVEWRSTDSSHVKIYEQLKPTDYADYKIGFCYIDPFVLYCDSCDGKIIDSLKSKIKYDDESFFEELKET